MKYTATPTECYSPKTPEVVFFCPWDVIYDPMDDTKLKQTKTDSLCSDQSSGSSMANSSKTSSSYIIDGGCQTDSSTEDVTAPSNRTPDYYRIPPTYANLRPSNESRVYDDADFPRMKSRRQGGIYVPRIVCGSLVLLLLCLTASTFALMFVLWGKYNQLKNEIENTNVAHVLAQQDPQMCLPCNELLQGPFDEDNVELRNLIHRSENGTEVCCAKSYFQMATLLNLFAKRKQLEKCALDKINENTTNCKNSSSSTPVVSPNVVSAHLLAGNQDPSNNIEEQPIKHWRSDKPGAHVQGLQLTDNCLLVPETGLYFLYSQAGFLIYYDKGNISKASQSIFHKVIRYQVIYPIDGSQELLRSEITQCWEPDKQYGRYTSYIGASVMLNKNDRLYVKVSRISELSSEPTYFGLYKIN